MDLFEIVDFLVDVRNYTRDDIYSMDFYEFRLELDVLKKREDAKEKKRNEQSNKQKQGDKNSPKMPSTDSLTKQASKSLTGFKRSIPKFK